MGLALAFEDSQPFRLTVDQYQALDEAGAFDEHDGRVELIEGMIVCNNSQTVPHMLIANELTFRLRVLLQQLGSPLTAYLGPTVAMPPHNAPDPDIFVGAKASGDGYLAVKTVSLLIEVSRASLRKDTKIKRDIYARAGVPEYWVVDVNKAIVHRFHTPIDGTYQVEPPISLAGPLASLTMPDLEVDGSGTL